MEHSRQVSGPCHKMGTHASKVDWVKKTPNKKKRTFHHCTYISNLSSHHYKRGSPGEGAGLIQPREDWGGCNNSHPTNSLKPLRRCSGASMDIHWNERFRLDTWQIFFNLTVMNWKRCNLHLWRFSRQDWVKPWPAWSSFRAVPTWLRMD